MHVFALHPLTGAGLSAAPVRWVVFLSLFLVRGGKHLISWIESCKFPYNGNWPCGEMASYRGPHPFFSRMSSSNT